MSLWNKYLSELPSRMATYKNEFDKRSRFKCDFDTICFSSSFRRLQDKAQVFPIEKGDFSRTRLTHSIEVMSVAESLGQLAVDYIIKKGNKKIGKYEMKKVKEIPTILKSSALIHDLGNPPFGHITEGVIRRWFSENLSKIYYVYPKNEFIFIENGLTRNEKQEYFSLDSLLNKYKNDFINFDSNAQSIRIVTELQNTTSIQKSMNLSYTTIATIIKYPYDFAKNSCWKPNKYGVFAIDEKLYKAIDSQLCLKGNRHPLTFLLEAADDIAYLSTDIEDAGKKNLISIREFIEEFHLYYEKLLKNKVNANKIIQSKLNVFTQVYYKILEMTQMNYTVVNSLNCESVYKDVMSNFYKSEDSSIIFRRILMYLKGQMIKNVYNCFCTNYKAIMNLKYKKSLMEVGKGKWIQEILRNIESKYIYYGTEIVKSKIISEKIINTLLDTFVISTLNMLENEEDEKNYLIPSLISTNFYNQFAKKIGFKLKESSTFHSKIGKCKVEEIILKLHMVLDEITGMTDSYALRVYDLIK